MDANYLKQNVGPVLASALTQLYAYGIPNNIPADGIFDPTHPHRDPIGFIGRYLLDYDKALKEMNQDNLQKQHLDSLLRNIEEQNITFKQDWGNVLAQLSMFLSQRELEKEMKLKMEAEAAQAKAMEEQARKEAEEQLKLALAEGVSMDTETVVPPVEQIKNEPTSEQPLPQDATVEPVSDAPPSDAPPQELPAEAAPVESAPTESAPVQEAPPAEEAPKTEDA